VYYTLPYTLRSYDYTLPLVQRAFGAHPSFPPLGLRVENLTLFGNRPRRALLLRRRSTRYDKHGNVLRFFLCLPCCASCWLSDCCSVFRTVDCWIVWGGVGETQRYGAMLPIFVLHGRPSVGFHLHTTWGVVFCFTVCRFPRIFLFSVFDC